MSPMLTIAKREYRSYFESPLAYVVMCLSFAALGVMFFMYEGGFWQRNLATLGAMFEYVPYGLCLLVVPVLTMRLLAEEKRSGTLEMLITLPVRDWEVIMGKFLGAWGLVLILIFASALYPIMMFKWSWDLGALDSGPVLAGYVGMIIYSAAAISIGLLISSLTENQIVALFITFIVLFFMHMIGEAHGPLADYPQAQFVISFISFDARMASFVRGLINLRDVVYFLSITAACLVGSFWALERRKWV